MKQINNLIYSNINWGNFQDVNKENIKVGDYIVSYHFSPDERIFKVIDIEEYGFKLGLVLIRGIIVNKDNYFVVNSKFYDAWNAWKIISLDIESMIDKILIFN